MYISSFVSSVGQASISKAKLHSSSNRVWIWFLKKCCSDFLGLDLGKDGLDYEKIRKPGDQLTTEEKIYIYDDVFGLSYLVKALKIDGLTLSGKTFKFTKLTNSSQSLHDYKIMLLHDFLQKNLLLVIKGANKQLKINYW